MASFTEGNRRLLELARILDRVPAAHRVKNGFEGYNQQDVCHPCGTPSCAWGFWLYGNKARFKRIAKEDLIDKESINKALLAWPRPGTCRAYVSYTGSGEREFGLSYEESEELFGAFGCGSAQEGSEAAAYIRSFVARRRKSRRLKKEGSHGQIQAS